MPYRRYSRYPRRRKKRTLSTRSIRKRTGAKSQSKQIMALTRQVRSLNKTCYSTLTTEWSRGSLPIQLYIGANTPFVCPLPVAPMDPLNTYTGALTSDTTQWCDNMRKSGATQYVKKLVFGQSLGDVSNGSVRHMGQEISYQISCSETNHTTVDLFVIQPRKHVADDLTATRLLKTLRSATGDAPVYGPQEDCLTKDLDYTCNIAGGSLGSTYFGSKFNPKWWKVMYHRTLQFASQGVGDPTTGAQVPVGSPSLNTSFARGTIRLPGAGKLESISPSSQRGGIGGVGQVQRCNGLELGYADERDEDARFLVAIQNGTTADSEYVSMALFGKDYYRVAS